MFLFHLCKCIIILVGQTQLSPCHFFRGAEPLENFFFIILRYSMRRFFLLILVCGTVSLFAAPEETIISSKFTTRHTATCHLSHCDPEVVQYFGYLPQDMVGRSLFEFYHPEDLPFIKDIYETVSTNYGLVE